MKSQQNGEAKTFLLHLGLLAYELVRLEKDVKGGLNEELNRRISLPGEDLELFGYFLEYLYRSKLLTEKQI